MVAAFFVLLARFLHQPPLPYLVAPSRPPSPTIQILLWDRLPVVRLRASLKKTMLHYDCLGADATPSFLRSHFRNTGIPHPCLALEVGGGTSSTSTPSSTASSTRSAQGRAVRGHAKPPASYAAAAAATPAAPGTPADAARSRPPAIRPDARSNALFLLKAATAGLSGDTFGELVGLPLLPLADGSLGRFLAPPAVAAAAGDEAAAMGAAVGGGHGRRSPTEDTIFVCSRAERRLLAGAGLGGEGGGAGNRLLEDLEDLDPAAKALLNNRRVHEATNVAVMEPSDLAGMLGAVFPEAWTGLTQVAWAPGSRDVSTCGGGSIGGVCGGGDLGCGRVDECAAAHTAGRILGEECHVVCPCPRRTS